MKRCAAPLCRLDPETTAVILDDRATDCQTKPDPVGLGRDEWFEQAGQNVRREPFPQIGHAALDGSIRALGRAHGEPPLDRKSVV